MARCCDAPPVLVLPSCTEPIEAVSGDAASVEVGPDGVVFACSPSLLDAMSPAEVVAAPLLLWMSADPMPLLARWVRAAEGLGLDGAAALVARRATCSPAPAQ